MRLVSLTGTSPRQGMAETPSSLYLPLCADQFQLAESCRAVVCHRRIPCGLERKPEAIPLDRDRIGRPWKSFSPAALYRAPGKFEQVCWKADPYGNPLADLDKSDPV
jgi:hypothetical protein